MDTMPFRVLGPYREDAIYSSGDIVLKDGRSYVMLEGEWVLLREAELEIDYSSLELVEEYDGQL